MSPRVSLPSLLLALTLVMSIAAPAAAQEEPSDTDPFSPESLVFPVDGPVEYADTWGAPRGGGRSHEGVDIMAEKGVPVVAAGDGVIGWVGSDCCYFSIDHGGGWETWYIHLNNDTPGTDDGAGCVTPDAPSCGIASWVEPDAPVEAGQVIGWVGDSGNAEGSGSHLHFEIRKDGVAISPYQYVLAAEGRDAPEPEPWWDGQFQDDEDSVHQQDIDRIFEEGLTIGCNPPDNTEFCPLREMSRGEMAAFIRRLKELPAAEDDFYTDDTGTVFENDINAITAAGIGFGCTETTFCADESLLREEMAELLVRTFEYENPAAENRFGDDEGNRFETSIDVLASFGITLGCNPPANTFFCPDRALSRGEMASFFVRALDFAEPPDPPNEAGQPIK